jgi:hypothetical protein
MPHFGGTPHILYRIREEQTADDVRHWNRDEQKPASQPPKNEDESGLASERHRRPARLGDAALEMMIREGAPAWLTCDSRNVTCSQI